MRLLTNWKCRRRASLLRLRRRPKMNPAARVLDVNLNRAREGLRCVEDYARFVLADAECAWRAKQLRHGPLRAIRDLVGPERLLLARDIQADVARDATTAEERRRETTLDVARSAFGRIGEAARSLSEFGKVVSVEIAPLAERLRYEAYALEQAVLLRGDGRRRLSGGGLYLLMTAELCLAEWLATAAAALRGGARVIQLREKNLSDREWLRRAEALRELTRAHDALLFVNDRPDLARLCGADGVHVGQDDLEVAQARSIAGADLLVGLSTHTWEQFEAARAAGADYIAIGPIFPSTTKPQNQLAGTAALDRAAKSGYAPLVAIGGITPENAAQVRSAGAHWLCVCAAVLRASDPEAAARELLSQAG